MSDTTKRLLRLAVSAAILGGLAAKTDWTQVSYLFVASAGDSPWPHSRY